MTAAAQQTGRSNHAVASVSLPASAPAVPHAPAPIAVSGTMTQYKTPKNTVLTIVKAGMAKGDLPWHHAFWLGVYAGAYIALGAVLSLVVAGGMTSTRTSLRARLFAAAANPALILCWWFGVIWFGCLQRPVRA